MEPISWSTSVQAAEWIGRALTAARNKDQQRFARVIEHAGIVVSGLRAIDREARSIFLPMFYGNISQWPESKRQEWIRRLISLAHEDQVMPALRISLSTLRDLQPQQADKDVERLLRILVKLLEYPVPAPGRRGTVDGPLEAVAVNVPQMLDWTIQAQLETLIQALTNPSDDTHFYSEMTPGIIKLYVDGGEFAASFINALMSPEDESSSLPRLYGLLRRARRTPASQALNEEGSPASTPPISNLRPYADKAEEILGRLLAIQNQTFPQLPTPTWIWQPSAIPASDPEGRS